MKVVITGAAGFLGSHIALRHLKRGDEVIGVDDFTSSRSDSKHLRKLREHPDFWLVQSNVIDEQFNSHVFNGTKRIYNFACPASPPVYQSMPVHTMMTCVMGMKNVLEFARQTRSIVVQASTSEVYGDPAVSPQPETYRGEVNSYGPRSCYDEGKRAAEALCYDYYNTLNVDARLVRIFNTYGPHMDPNDGRVVTNFLQQALKGEKLTIFGDGSQTRSFCYVDDLVTGIVKMGDLERNPGTPINLGNPKEFTMLDLAMQVLSTVGKFHGGRYDDMIIHRALPIDDPTQRKPDITLAQNILGWQPVVTLEQGLRLMLPYML